MVRVEFTIEPFVDGDPGEHVTAAIAAVRALGVDVELGPFASACEVAPDRVGAVLEALSDAALAQGASHLTIHVARRDEVEA